MGLFYQFCVQNLAVIAVLFQKPDVNSQDGYEVKKLTGGPRYCRSCDHYKPPRAHHCRQCQRSVTLTLTRRSTQLTPWQMRTSHGSGSLSSPCLKSLTFHVDHHCPWINNCVGHFNYGHFIRFLFYVDLACLYHFAMVTRRVLHAVYGDDMVLPNRCRQALKLTIGLGPT